MTALLWVAGIVGWLAVDLAYFISTRRLIRLQRKLIASLHRSLDADAQYIDVVHKELGIPTPEIWARRVEVNR